jgi:hypothetical protein
MSVSRNFATQRPPMELRPFQRLKLAVVGLGVVFACLGAGEAVYRLLFLEFDGATDRLPIEMAFGLAFAWVATKLARRIYERRMDATARMELIWDRNHKIRHALQAIAPVPHPGHQQAIRVIRDEVDQIEWVLSDIRSL